MFTHIVVQTMLFGCMLLNKVTVAIMCQLHYKFKKHRHSISHIIKSSRLCPYWGHLKQQRLRVISLHSVPGTFSSWPFSVQADKRAHHNALERKRRDHIKDSFHGLRDSVPALQGEKVSKRKICNTGKNKGVSVLTASWPWIVFLWNRAGPIHGLI